MTEYTIHRTRFGFTVSSPFPAREMKAITKLGHALDYDIVDALVASELGVAMAITNAEQSEKWREELGCECPCEECEEES